MDSRTAHLNPRLVFCASGGGAAAGERSYSEQMGRRVLNNARRTTAKAAHLRRPQDISEGNRTIQNSNASNTAGLMDYFVITTPNFVLDHEETISQNVGGQQWKKCKNLFTNPKSLSRPQGTK
uniref:Uncharacterized protein n=1 Tax=Oryza rufipogon TaxID=4529 RepID=A0A0E0MTP1_ORYRU